LGFSGRYRIGSAAPGGLTIFKLAILTISDAGSRGEREDVSGDTVSEMMASTSFQETRRELLPDEQELISEKLIEWCDSGDIDLVLTTGGTGLGPRDVTPEATRKVIDLEVPGMAEAMRMESLNATPFAMIGRAVVGVRNGCLIVNLPGSPKAVRENLEVVLGVIPHAVEILRGGQRHPTSGGG
jgi:molybdenum cofactor synthesis domain-containing protein